MGIIILKCGIDYLMLLKIPKIYLIFVNINTNKNSLIRFVCCILLCIVYINSFENILFLLQLCVSFCNLCCLLESVDVSNLTYLFDSRLHVIQIEMAKFCNLIDIPNYSETLASAHNHLNNLLKTKQLTSKQFEIINSLLNILNSC